jgi:D-alanine-D-alanine ligase
MPESKTPALSVAVICNRKHSIIVAPDAPPDALAEYDVDVTLEAILSALQGAGHDAFFLEADDTLLDTLRESRPDFCFNIAEGLRGESRESHIPALLEMLGIPYTASKVLAHAISLDKAITKQIWRDAGLPTAPFQLFRTSDALLDPALAYPLFVKPVREGSGMGINAKSLVTDEPALREQVAWVIATYRQPALVEAYLPGREFTVGIVGNRLLNGEPAPSDFYDENGFHVFPILEIDSNKGAVRGIYNAQAKGYDIHTDEAPGYLCPADISAELEQQLKTLAVAAHEAIGALDMSRVDFRCGPDGEPYLVETNTLPGLNPILSDIVISATAEGVAHAILINEILDLARRRYGLL